jgi:hypothetical protein
VKIVQDDVFLLLPLKDQLDALLATNLHCITRCNTDHSDDFEAKTLELALQTMS